MSFYVASRLRQRKALLCIDRGVLVANGALHAHQAMAAVCTAL